ncbi:MAG: type II toxin-antitoxin system CcdA family antitoxin [Rhodopila sp.]|jgi:antitoxin CcdA
MVNQIRRQDDGPKRATNVSLAEALVAEARELGVNVSRACEEGLESAVRRERARRWQEENVEGFRSWNAFVERHGVPLAKFRKF